MSENYMGCWMPDSTGGGCWVLVRRHTGSLFPQSSSCGMKAREGKLTCRYHAKYEEDAIRTQNIARRVGRPTEKHT